MADDDKSNVIPFAWRGSADYRSDQYVLLKSIEFYGFESEAGPLQNCAEWIELCRRLK